MSNMFVLKTAQAGVVNFNFRALLYALKIKDLFYVEHVCVEDSTGRCCKL